ncbi:SDR family NAD(P)-dependent oxidoreductase [Streptomyces bobili]|uniref:SDR family NAD(P)-dependent oxidoreductase n=1 Tax=Streptomyces bobili TaxID=67280 RepID=UPI0037017E9E
MVTGGNRGIGRETARQLAALGHTVLLSARRPEDAERAVADLAPEVPGMLLPCRLDVTDADGIRALAHRVEGEFGRLDALVNNAAINYDTSQRAVSVDLDVVRQTLETNLFGVWRTTQALRSTGHILDVLDVLHRDRLALRIHDGAFSAMDLTARHPRTGELLSTVKFMVQTLAAAGELQRDLQRELTYDGLRAAEAKGNKGGRRPAVPCARREIRDDVAHDQLIGLEMGRDWVDRRRVMGALAGPTAFRPEGRFDELIRTEAIIATRP